MQGDRHDAQEITVSKSIDYFIENHCQINISERRRGNNLILFLCEINILFYCSTRTL